MKIPPNSAEIIVMPAVISLKKSFLFLLVGLICAAAAAFLINFILSGPKLGPVFDFFQSHRQPSPVSREILIINADEFVENGDIFTVLTALTEFDAVNLILTARIAGSSSPLSGTETEIRGRFNDEYSLLGSNIRNLFDAIRSGSIAPSQANHYVDRLVELTEKSKDRLLLGLIERDEDLLRSIAVFGNFQETDIKPLLDWDGKIRRVFPADTESSFEHPVYRSLKDRYAKIKIEASEIGIFLIFSEHNGNKWEIPLDRDGNIITVANGFRSIDLALFREYEEAGRVMRRLLKDADDLGAFSKIQPENSPLFLDDYASVLKEEMLNDPSADKRAAWIYARYNYYKYLNDFLFGNSENALVSGYDNVIAEEETLKEEGLVKLKNMRDDIINLFFSLREQYGKLMQVYYKLQEELASSFCIIGPKDNTEYSALLANAMITGSHITPVSDKYVLFWSITTVFLFLMIIFRLRPLLLLFIGFGCAALAAFVFGWNFVITSYWIEPAVVFGSTICGTLVLFFCRSASMRRRARSLRTAYGPFVSRQVLKELIKKGGHELSEKNTAYAAVIAIKDFNLLSKENSEKPQEAGKAQKIFFSDVRKIAFNAGAVIAGFEGDTVFVCFGSPLGKSGKTIKDPVLRAYAFIKDLLKNEKITWRFGLDAGECTFSWSPETGFAVKGRPVVRAKILVSKTLQRKSRALVTGLVREKINMHPEKSSPLININENFYENVRNREETIH